MPGGEVPKEDVTQKVDDENQPDLKAPYTVERGINGAVQGHPPKLPGQEDQELLQR